MTITRPHWSGRVAAVTWLLTLGSVVGGEFEPAAAVLLEHCVVCHGPAEANGGLDLTTAAGIMAGGDGGAVVVPGRSAESRLVIRAMAGEMPPKRDGTLGSLPDDAVATLAAWVDGGAEWPAGRVLDPFERTTSARAGRDWWSLHPPADRAPPADGHPIDAFLAARRMAAGVEPAPEADRRTLLRRLSFDLIGLPPTADEVDAFVADPGADAYERAVERLLASPHFGERQARHWLDVVRYAETNGYERDAEKPGAWRYRDWVIAACNADMPYDRFVIEQLAGDELPDRSESTVVATGLLRLGTWDDEPNDDAEYQYERLEDLVHVTSTAFLGLTLKCARCHDHKFDPLTHADYYKVAAAFWPGPVRNRNRDWQGGPSREELGHDVLGWTDVTTDPAPLRVLKKGDPSRPLEEVVAGPPSCIPELAHDFSPPPADARTTTRRLQLARWITDSRNPLTARVIVNRIWQRHFGTGLVANPDNFGFAGGVPLHRDLLDWLARDLVAGGWRLKRLHRLIATSAAYRQASVHPREAAMATRDPDGAFLWKAARRRLDAESLRDAILSTSGELDPRIGGESFRAPITAEALEGLSMKGGAYAASPPDDCRRRSIYMFTKRSLIVPLMTAFDMCDTTLPTGRRDVSIVAPQALALLNNAWVRERSRHAAAAVLAGSDDSRVRVVLAWRRLLGRSPSSSERDAALMHVDAVRTATDVDPDLAAWASLCHVLLNTNEFIFVD